MISRSKENPSQILAQRNFYHHNQTDSKQNDDDNAINNDITFDKLVYQT